MENNKFGITWQDPVKVEISYLKDWTKNPRKITREGYNKLVTQIKRSGFHAVLLVDQDDTIISGHQRKRALKELGITHVWVMYPDHKLSEEEREVVAIESNKESGMFDFDILANEFSFESLKNGGFEDFELSFATSSEDDGKDINPLAHSMEVYLKGNQKQVSFFFSSEEFEELLPRLDKIMTEKEFKAHKEVLLFLLAEHENNNS